MKSVPFKGRILIFGSGSVAQCLLPLIKKHIAMDFSKLTVMDPLYYESVGKRLKSMGANYIQKKVLKENYLDILKKQVGPGDIIIDLAVDIETIDIIDWGQKNNVRFINTSVEWWNPWEDDRIPRIIDRTLYVRHMALIKKAQESWKPDGPTAIVEHGANPGLVSHWTKQALIEIAHQILNKKLADKKRTVLLHEALDSKNFPELAQHTGTKVIHISERDMQTTNKPKLVDEFVNTWSIAGLYEEAMAPAELGWGTHERTMPSNAEQHRWGPKNQICLAQPGMDTWMYSWIPSGQIIGMLIRHGEAFSISRYYTVLNKNKAVYRPTVHYVYLPTDCTVASLVEMKMHNYKLQPKLRILNDEIIDGIDELGVLLLGHDLNGWWTGSQLSIQETRELIGSQQNATTLQVASSVLAALIWSINNPNKGFRTPDDLPHDEILSIARPYLGPCPSVQTDWTPFTYRTTPLGKKYAPKFSKNDVWQFKSFLVTP